jgi:hypothetical protein
MLKKYCFILISFLVLCLPQSIHSQDRYVEIENKLKELSKKNIGLNDRIEISVKSISIQELAQAISASNNLNTKYTY